MTNATSLSHLNDPAAAARLNDQEWVKLHVPRFASVQSHYDVYKKFLFDVLAEFCHRVAPMAIVQTRAKGVPSFAEKILRKRKDYVDPTEPLPPDPLVRLTDLCGGRVITQTASQVRAICRLVEQCFDIDWANSDDASTRLKTTEFGYRTVNYIVMANPEKLGAAGIDIPVPAEVLGPVRPETAEPVRLKAEIQVRTLLEHAYADIGHDLTYKTEVKVPDRIYRSFSAVAAMLETADHEFGRLVESLDSFRSNFGAYHTRKQVEDEITRLRAVLPHDPDSISLVVRIAQLSHVIGEHQQAIEILTPYSSGDHQNVQGLLGTILTELHWDKPRSQEFGNGRDLLVAACNHPKKNAELLCSLAECWTHCDNAEEAGKCFSAAIAVDAAEPRSLCGYLEFQVGCTSNHAIVQLAEPMIRNAMERCRIQIEGRVNLPNAWSCLTVFRLLVGDKFGALDALAHLLDLCEKPNRGTAGKSCASSRAMSRLRTVLSHLRSIKEKLSGFDWLERATLLGLAVGTGDAEALAELRAKASWGAEKPIFKREDSVVILSGGCASEVEGFMPPFREQMQSGAEGLSFIMISGGTTMGISGVAGDLARESKGRISAVGYLPGPMHKAQISAKWPSAFNVLYPSTGTDFTPLEPLQGWTDLVAAGVDPGRVKLLSYAGGSISKVECALAMAFGARVGVILNADLPKDRQFNDPAWTSHPNRLPLPLDAMTLHAFIRMESSPLTEEDKRRLEPAAQMAHEDYAKSATPKDPSLQSWKDLDGYLKLSNYHQVAFWENVLSDFGLGVRGLTDEDKQHDPLEMAHTVGEDGIRKLAEMEHGRWNVERLGYGWRYAREKDVLKRLSPYLIPWQQVPPNIQQYDLDAIRGLPKKLREAGLELVQIKRNDPV